VIADATGSAALASAPPMGWMSWNVFARDLSEEVVLHAEAMLTPGCAMRATN